jgi:hypothetical protein
MHGRAQIKIYKNIASLEVYIDIISADNIENL